MSFYDIVLVKILKINRFQKERGSILVLTALLLPIMFGCLGIAYDVGNIYIHKARLQNVTDAAALAGGRAYLQSQLNTGESAHKDTYDNYTNGNVTDVEYVVGGNGGISITREGHHPDADKAADDYIRKNIVNLGKTVFSDKFSHYALPGLKKVGEDYINDSKIFYRIGLYEKVPLYFLSVITNKKVETVRAGSVVVVEPGTPGTPGTPGGNPTITMTTSAPTVFDNLFTYKDSINPGLVVENGEIKKKFTGDIVYTYGNGSGDVSGTDAFFSNNATIGGVTTDTVRHFYVNKDNGLETVSNINDPIINNYYNTTDYLDVFKNKLLSPHVDIQSNNYTISGNGAVSSEVFTCIYSYSGNHYIKIGKTFYRVTSDQANSFSTVTYNGETYKICYQPYPGNENRLVLCGKKDNDNKYYLLNSSGEITQFYIEEKIQSQYEGENGYSAKKTNVSNITLNNINSNSQYIKVDKGTLIGQNHDKQTKVNSQQGNIFHYNSDLSYSTSDGFTLTISNSLGSSTEPIYVMIGDDVTNITINANGNAQSRPVIVIYFGSGRINFENQGVNSYYNGTIYAPYAYFWANFSGTFTGNVIADGIRFQTNSVGTWIQHNYLSNDNDITAVTTVSDRMAASAQALTPAAGNTTDTIEKLKSALEDKICDKLGVTKEQLNNKDWYNEQPYSKKMELYGKWEALYKSYSANDPLRNMLWPWDIRITTTISSSEGGTGTPPTPGTPDLLRLINYRTDYQMKENLGNDDVVDPFIFETLGQPNSYGL